MAKARADSTMIGRGGVLWPYSPNDQMSEKTERFYDALKSGQVVHVQRAAGQKWLRARFDGSALVPFAMVGSGWGPDDRPHDRGGRVHTPYDVGLVLTGQSFRPAAEIIWEAALPGSAAGRVRSDPSALKAVDLNKPARAQVGSLAKPSKARGPGLRG